MRKLVGLAAAVVVAAPAHAGLIPDSGMTGGATDPVWSVIWRAIDPSASGFGSAANASLITNTPSPWQANVPGANSWLGVNSVGSIDTRPDAAHRYEYAFTTRITLLTPQTVTGAIGFDNFFIGAFIGGSFDPATGKYTRGEQVLTPTELLGAGNENKSGFCRNGDGFAPSGAAACAAKFAIKLAAGTYVLTFVTQGDGVTDGFLMDQPGLLETSVLQLEAPISQPSTLALLGLGVLALAWTQRRRGTRTKSTPRHSRETPAD